MKKLIACIALAGLSALAWALPTQQQVEAQVRQGNYAQAESMMREVVAVSKRRGGTRQAGRCQACGTI